MAISIVSSSDGYVEKVVKDRDLIQQNYIGVLMMPLMIPLIEMRRHGDCTVDDPRACLNYHGTGADLACILWANMSENQFQAMIVNNRFINNTLVVLHCTHYNTYVYRFAANIKRDGKKRGLRVEDMLRNLQTDSGECKTGVEMLGLDYEFVELPSSHRRKRMRDCGLDPKSCDYLITSVVMTERQFLRHTLHSAKLNECQRTLQTEQVKDRICRPGTQGKTLAPGQKMKPHPLIHAEFMIKAPLRHEDEGFPSARY